MFGHANAADMCSMVYDVIQLVSTKLLLNLSMDGQNIDKSLWDKEVNERLISISYPGLLPLVFCWLRIVHKAFHCDYAQN